MNAKMLGMRNSNLGRMVERKALENKMATREELEVIAQELHNQFPNSADIEEVLEALQSEAKRYQNAPSFWEFVEQELASK